MGYGGPTNAHMIELVTQNSKTGKAWDISELATDIGWETSLTNSAGKLTFKLVDDGQIDLNEGAPVTFKYRTYKLFYGYIVSREINQDGMISVTAYDQLFYFKNKDTYVLNGQTADQILGRICSAMNIQYTIKDKSWYVVPQKVMDNKSFFEMVQYGVDQTLINTSNWYTVYDDYGTITFNSFANMATDYYLGDEASLSGFSFKSSIESDTYNQVKLVKENKETMKREIYIVKDSNTIKEWGLLQYFETVDEKANFAQISNRADMLLKVKNRKTRSLKVTSVDGKPDLRAGSGVVVSLSKLAKDGFEKPQYFMVSSCKHKFSNGDHTMDLELRLGI